MLERTERLEAEEYESIIDMAGAARFLGYGAAEPEEDIKREMTECAKRLRFVLRPRFTYSLAPLDWEMAGRGQLLALFPDKKLCLPGLSIQKHLQGCESVLGVGLTLGEEVDCLIAAFQKKSMLQALLLDALANAAAERLRLLTERRAALDFPERALNWLFGIGYGDLPLALQGEFLESIQAKKKIGLECSSQNILSPLKSVTGFIGLKAQEKG